MLIRNKIRQRDWAECVTDGLERREDVGSGKRLTRDEGRDRDGVY
jgi:hypothetical protein